MQTVHIPKPCHENWNEMSPTQKGAFCGKCAVDVVDFSKMQNDEVKTFLEENKGKHLCGRFGNDQLDAINKEEDWFKNSSWSGYMSKFVCALVVTFGISLFNGLSAQEDKQIKYMTLGMVAYIEPDTSHTIEKTDSTKIEIEADTAKTIIEEPIRCGTTARHLKGKVAYTPPVEEVEIVEDSLEIEEPFIMGDIAYEEEPVIEMTKGEIMFIEEDSTKKSVNTDSIARPSEVIKSRYTLSHKQPNAEQSSPKKAPALILEPTTNSRADSYSLTIFPNPTATASEILIINTEEQIFEIYLFSAKGELVSTIYKGLIPLGEKRFSIDLQTLSTGIYYMQFMTIHGAETHKIQKVE